MPVKFNSNKCKHDHKSNGDMLHCRLVRVASQSLDYSTLIAYTKFALQHIMSCFVGTGQFFHIIVDPLNTDV